MFNMGFPPSWSTIKKLMWIKTAVLSAVSWIVKTVTGTAPITLPNAVSHAIQSLTQFGKCVQSGTPTPTSPVDIVCNNGVLRYGALGQNLLDPSAANTILGYYINKADGELKPAASNFMFAGYMPVEAGKTYVAYGRAKTGDDLSDYNRIAWYDSSKNWISGADYTQNRIAVATAPVNAAYARFSCNPSGVTTVTVTQELVDSYNWTFCEGTAEPATFVPFIGGIYTEGESEVLTVSKVDTYTAVDGQGTYASPGAATNRIYKAFNVRDGNYTISVPTAYDFIVQYKTPTDGSMPTDSGNITSWVNGYTTVTLDKGTAYGYGIALRLHDSPNGNITPGDFDGTITIVHNSTVQTVTDIPMLLSVGDYKDEAEIISGIKTGRCKVIVFDGTENWKGDNAAKHYLDLTDGLKTNNYIAAPCTRYKPTTHGWGTMEPGEAHYDGSSTHGSIDVCDTESLSLTDFTAKLAGWYAAGEPMMMVYPLATPTTEQGTPHALHSYNGTTVVDVTANVSSITLTAEYYATE